MNPRTSAGTLERFHRKGNSGLHILHMIFCFMQAPEKESGIQTEKNWPEDDPRCHCMWISRAGRRRKTHMRRTTARELGRTLLNALENAPFSAEVLAEICRQYPGTRKHTQKTGCAGFDD
jgi:hypothetical protein